MTRRRLTRRLSRIRKYLLAGPEPFEVRCKSAAKWLEVTELELAPRAKAAADQTANPKEAR